MYTVGSPKMEQHGEIAGGVIVMGLLLLHVSEDGSDRWELKRHDEIWEKGLVKLDLHFSPDLLLAGLCSEEMFISICYNGAKAGFHSLSPI